MRAVAWTVLGLVVAIALVIGVGAWVLGRETTLQRIVAEVQKRLDGQLEVENVRGSLYDRIAFDRLVYRTTTQTITLEQGSLRYALEPFARRFTVRELRTKTLTIAKTAESDEKTTEPETLEIPASARLDTVVIEDAAIDAIRIVDASKAGVEPSTTVALHDAKLKGRYADKRWIVEAVSIDSPWGRASGGGSVAATRPFALDARIDAEGRVAGAGHDVPYRAPVVIEGELANLRVASDVKAADPTGATVEAHVDARVFAFRDQPLEAANVRLTGVRPKHWKDDLPEAELDVDAHVVPLTVEDAASRGRHGANPFAGEVRLSNARPGPIDRDRIPVASLVAKVVGDADGLDLSDATADLAAAGQVKGRGAAAFDGSVASFDGAVRTLDLRAIHGKLIATRFAGPLQVTKKGDVVSIDTRLADAGRDIRRSVQLRGEIEGQQVRIADARVAVGGSRVQASGRVALDRERAFALEGEVTHLDPRDFGDFARADVTGAFKVDGTIGATATTRVPQAFDVVADLRIAPSHVFDRAVAGTASGNVKGTVDSKDRVALRSIANAKVALALGANRVDANGSFGRPGDRLAWHVDAPKLADLASGTGIDVAGVLKGDGTLGGTFAEPSIDFDVAGDDLRYASRANAKAGTEAAAAIDARASAASPTTARAATTVMSLRTLRAKGRLLAGPSGVLDADVSLAEFRDGSSASGPPAVQAAELHVKGTRDAHQLTLSARSDRFDVSGAAHGGLDASNTWHGSVDALDSRGRVPFSIERAASLVANADRVEVGSTRLKFTDGYVDLDRLVYADETIATSGRAGSFPLAIVATFSRDFARQVSTSLKFGGQWDLRIGPSTIDGKVRLYRESGNVEFLTEPRFTVDPERIEVDADIVANRVSARVAANGRGLGRIDASVDTQLSKREGTWGLAGDASLALKGDVDIPDLRWLARLSGRPGLDVYGRLQVAVSGRGTVAAPLLSGHATGDEIGVRWPDQGLNFRDGKLDVDFDGDRVVLKQATLASGDGRLSANGEVRLANRRASGTLSVKVDRFEAVSRTDRTVVVSGSGQARFGSSGVDVTADVKADRGNLQLAERRGPTMSDDIVIVGRDVADEPTAASVPVRFDVRFDMGDDFKVRGSGFEGRLGGAMRIVGTPAALRAVGTVAVREGVYVAYGQTLTIVRGNLTFSGPIDNPALDILAVRKNLAVEAGVLISGTALAPVARLTSTPEVPDTEKLSWLVLGHGLSTTSKSDLGLLTTAAASLLGSSDSPGIQARIAATLGVDEIGVTGLGGDTGGLLTVGKQISSRLRVTFEQGFQKAATLIKARYNIYKQIDLQVQTGTETAVDLFYTFSFD